MIFPNHGKRTIFNARNDELMLQKIIKTHFIILYLGIGLVFLYPVLVFPKGSFELLINQHHTPALDVFFKYITNLGDGTVLAAFLLILLLNNYAYTIFAAFAVAVQSIFVSIFKRWLFAGLARPVKFFGDGVDLNFVDGVDVHSYNTFPSGHTASAFVLFALVAVLINHKNILLGLTCFILAMAVGLSRVYLLQHFVIDAYFGAFFGVLSVLIGAWMCDIFFSRKAWEGLQQKSLLTTLRKKS